jgi:hypothetical protein
MSSPVGSALGSMLANQRYFLPQFRRDRPIKDPFAFRPKRFVGLKFWERGPPPSKLAAVAFDEAWQNPQRGLARYNGGADGGAVPGKTIKFHAKKQGAAGITTAAPHVAGQWGRGE